jgi:choline/glycine/proline betaine transport protein
MFIARISRGRRIRELIFGVMLVPLGFTLAWLSIFGNTAINLVMNEGAASLGATALADPPMAFYKLMEFLPMTKIVAAVGVLMSFMLFLTPVDSGTLMIANLSARHADAGHDAPIWLRIFWAALTTLLGVGLLLAGNFNAMQTAVVLCGLPFSVVLLCYMANLYTSLSRDNPEPRPSPATR